MITKKVILSAYTCDPSKGSEPGNGFNWAKYLASFGHTVYCITTSKGRKAIEGEIKSLPSLEFVYVDLPLGLDKIYSWNKIGMYLHYLIWQWLAYKQAKNLNNKVSFDLVHHVTWGSLQQGSFMYKMPIPLIFGPAGGGQYAPESFKHYFKQHWSVEIKRRTISEFLQKYNPACYKMIKRSKMILATNMETYSMASKLGAKEVHHILDAALPKSFFPKEINKKNLDNNSLKLLWVGRFLPRKGILLILDVMQKLRHLPDITLTVVGDGEMKDEFLSSVKDLDIEKQINWVGRVPFEKVKEYYATHDAFFFTSLRDSSPAQLIEAMSFGLPVITLNLHGQGTMITEECGFKASTSDSNKTIDELTEFIIELKNNLDLRRFLSENAFKYASNQTWEAKIKHVSQHYY